MAAVVLPLLLSAAMTLGQSGGDWYPGADHAVLEVEEVNAVHGHQLTGTYSRFRWHHPNPIYFYVNAPLYELTGHSPVAMNATALLIQVVSCIGIVLIAWRWGGRVGGLTAAAVAALWIARMGPLFMRDYWVPYVVALPFALYVLLCAAVAAGSVRLLPVLAIVGSFLAGTNLSCAPAVVVLFAAALAVHTVLRSREPERFPPRLSYGPWALAAVAVVGLVWLPPVWDALEHRGGNLSQLGQFFTTDSELHPPADAWSFVANSMATLARGPIPTPLFATPLPVARLLLAGFLIATIAGAVVGVVRRRWFATALCTLATVGTVGEVVAAMNIRGELFAYLGQWFATLGIGGVIGLALAIGPELRPVRALVPEHVLIGVLMLTVLALGTFNVAKAVRHRSLHEDETYYAGATQLWRQVATYVDRHRIRDPLIRMPGGTQWAYAATVIAARQRHGLPTAIDYDRAGFMFGRALAKTGQEDATLYFQEPHSRPPVRGAPVVAKTKSTVVFAVRS